MKKYVLLCTVCALLLGGCGSVADSPGDEEQSEVTALESSSQESTDESSQETTEDSSKTDDSSTAEEDTGDLPSSVTPIPQGAETELVLFAATDMNSSDDPNARIPLELFEKYGGIVRVDRFKDANDRYDELAMRLISGTDIPDMMWMDSFAFPSYAVKEVFQPIDGIVDFGQELWAETQSAADLYSLNGKHYAAPISVTPASMILYRQDVFEENGLDDPYELYQNGVWNRRAMFDLMDAFCQQEGHYGINGYFVNPLLRAEGMPVVGYNGRVFTNFMRSDRMVPIINSLYDIRDRGWIASGWWDEGEKALENGDILFYSMGTWSMTGSRALTEQKYGLVPMPSENNEYIAGDVHAMLWVAGSEKSDAMRTWLECMRFCETDTRTQEIIKNKFLENDPGWTDEMYEVYKSQTGFDKPVVSEYAYGLSTGMTVIDQDLGFAPADLVTDPVTQVYRENGYTWKEVIEMYSALIDRYIQDYNDYEG